MNGREKSSNAAAPPGLAHAGVDREDLYAPSRPVRVIVTPLSAPLIHPLSKRDVQRVLTVLPEETTAGLRSVSLLADRWTHEGLPVLATYRREGFLRLHAVSSLPWRLNIPDRWTSELGRCGADIAEDGETRVVTWTKDQLRLFYVTGVLLPGLARHRRERGGGPEPSPVVRSLDQTEGPWLVTDTALKQWAAFLAEDSL